MISGDNIPIMATKYWLVKSEPTTYSIDSLKSDKKTLWDGVRNYQARNFLKEMKKGDLVLFYHSVTEPIGVSGVAKVSKEAVPDPTQFDKKSDYYDPDSKKDAPRWFCPELSFEKKFAKIVDRPSLVKDKKLSSMMLMQKGSRLSVTPVTKEEFTVITSKTK